MSSSSKNPQPQNYPKKDDKPNNENDFSKFLASLRMEKGLRSPLYHFQGFWHHPKMLQGFLASQKHFQAQDSDILLITFPKCGTTWLKALLFTLINRKKHPPSSQQHPLLAKNPHGLVPFLEPCLYGEGNEQFHISSTTTRRLLATHSPVGLLPKSVLESKCKLVYLSRNPKDTFVSYWHFAMKTKPENYAGVSSIEEAVDMFCKGVSICGPFWDHVLDYWNASLEKPDKVFFLTYEQLQSEPIPLVRRLTNFLGYGFSSEEEDSGMVNAIVKMCSFEYLSKLEVNSSTKVLGDGITSKSLFRRGEAGDWKNHLKVELANLLDDVTKQKFQGSGLLDIISDH